MRVLEQLVAERKAMDNLLGQAAWKDKVCLRLMTIPGVGAITSLAFRVTVDDPARFYSSKAIGAALEHNSRVRYVGTQGRPNGEKHSCRGRIYRPSIS